MPYKYSDLIAAYRQLGLSDTPIVYVAGELWRLMEFEQPDDETKGDEAVCVAHLKAIRETIGPAGTLVVFTGTVNLCNTDIPFDPASTPSHMSGVFSEFIRRQPGAVRSFHPFESMAALGPRARDLLENISRHAYGEETPWARIIAADGVVISIGALPNHTSSIVHHVEQMMCVPYRYVKEYIHPVVRGGGVVRETFYRYTWYPGIGLESDRNKKIFRIFEATGGLRTVQVGRGNIYAYSSSQFYAQAKKMFIDDIYVWCAQPPVNRPYQA